MNVKVIVGSVVLAGATAIAVAAGSAKATTCTGPLQSNWTQTSRCPGLHSNDASSVGIGTPGSSTAKVRAALDFDIPGGFEPDTADAWGVTATNRVAGTPPCYTGDPGCVFCLASDTDPSSGQSATSLAVCQDAVKHFLNLAF